ncbi:MAG: bifunctional 3,4-dihydroxy-2-butanone-4-phosphate synthase/GTP cyclohydrolase II [Planctomycetota bacterium]
MPISPIEEVVEDLRAGRMIILVDDPDRENEGDLAMLADAVDAEAINFMAKEGRGLICMPMSSEVCDRLELPMQASHNTNAHGTAFTVSIEAASGVSTGISAADRAHTIRVAARPDAKATDLARPGHIFPLRAKDGGVLVRGGQTEGIVDLARLAGSQPAGVICEIMNDDGTMARMPELEVFADTHDLKICTIADLIEYRRRNEQLVESVAGRGVPIETEHGMFLTHVFKSKIDGKEHVALTRGIGDGTDDGTPADPIDGVVHVRVHSECLTGDVFGSQRCDCGPQLDKAMEILSQQERGVVVYLRQEGRGIGLGNKLKAYHLQDEGLDTVEANEALGLPVDLREYGIGAQILFHLGVRKMSLLTNNPKKIHGLAGYGLELVDQVPLETPANPNNIRYLKTKRERMGHTLSDALEGDVRAEKAPPTR